MRSWGGWELGGKQIAQFCLTSLLDRIGKSNLDWLNHMLFPYYYVFWLEAAEIGQGVMMNHAAFHTLSLCSLLWLNISLSAKIRTRTKQLLKIKVKVASNYFKVIFTITALLKN